MKQGEQAQRGCLRASARRVGVAAMGRSGSGRAWCGLLGVLALVGCTTPIDPNYEALLTPAEASVMISASTLGAGDRIMVRVYEDPSMGGEFGVASDGTISFPRLGKLKVGGMTCSELEDDLVRRLGASYIRSPSVTCTVTAFNSKKVFVFGEVKQPGAFAYEDNMSVVQAVTLAGGFAERAAVNETAIVREVNGAKVRARVPMDRILGGEVENLALRPGDIVFVPTSIY